MTPIIAGVVVAVGSRGKNGLYQAMRIQYSVSTPGSNSFMLFSRPSIPLHWVERAGGEVLQTVTSLIINEKASNRSIAGVGVVVVLGAKRLFLYFFHQNADFLLFSFNCYTVTKVVRHSVSKGFSCNTPSKLLQSVTCCYKFIV